MRICFLQAEDGIRDLVRSRGLGDVYKRQVYGIELDKSKQLSYKGFPQKLIYLHPEQHGWERFGQDHRCLLYTSPSPRDRTRSRMPSSA